MLLCCMFVDTELSKGYDCLSSKILVGRKSRSSICPVSLHSMEPKETRGIKQVTRIEDLLRERDSTQQI